MDKTYTLIKGQTDPEQTMFELEVMHTEEDEELCFWMHTNAWEREGSPEKIVVHVKSVE